MGSIGRYIFRATLGAFLVVLVSVTLLMWITQALRNFELLRADPDHVVEGGAEGAIADARDAAQLGDPHRLAEVPSKHRHRPEDELSALVAMRALRQSRFNRRIRQDALGRCRVLEVNQWHAATIRRAFSGWNSANLGIPWEKVLEVHLVHCLGAGAPERQGAT